MLATLREIDPAQPAVNERGETRRILTKRPGKRPALRASKRKRHCLRGWLGPARAARSGAAGGQRVSAAERKRAGVRYRATATRRSRDQGARAPRSDRLGCHRQGRRSTAPAGGDAVRLHPLQRPLPPGTGVSWPPNLRACRSQFSCSLWEYRADRADSLIDSPGTGTFESERSP